MPRVVLPAILFAVAPAVAQQDAFVERQFPGGAPSGISSLGKLAHFVDGTTLRVWSAATRRWHETPVAVGATVYATNDLLVVRSPGQWVAFGATRARFEPVSVSAAAQVVNPASQGNDTALLVRDGTLLHAFSGFTGRWSTRPVSATAAVAVARHVALVADGTTASGFDAYTGQWVDQALGGPVVILSADGVCGIASTTTTAYGFSALRRAWSSSPCNGGASLLRNDDWAILHDGAFALGYSGLTNTFASVATGPWSSATGEDLVGAFTTPGLAWCYSAMTGAFSTAPLTSNGSLRVTAAAALVADGPHVIGYSAATGQWATANVASGGEALAGSVLAVVDAVSGRPSLFSALTGQWHPAPADANSGMPRVATTGAWLSTATGAYAFSARTGSFVALSRAGLQLASNENSAPLFAWDASQAHFFDARADRWISIDRVGSGPLQPQIWRTCGFAVDGGEVIGFSAQAGTLCRRSWPQSLASFRANSESAVLVGQTSVLAFSGVPEALPLSQFPDFRRVACVGAPFVLHSMLRQGSVALLGIGPRAPDPMPLPGLGSLLLDPACAVTALMSPEPDTDRAVFSTSLPADPVLRGQSVWFQALVAPANEQPYLTDAGVLWIG